MACGGSTGRVQKRLVAYSSTQAVEWFTDWQLCVGMDEAMVVMKGKAASSSYFEAQIVAQYAAVRTDNPGTPTLKGSVQTPQSGSFEYNAGILNIASDTDAKMYIRWGVAYNYTSGQSQASADVELEVHYVQCGQVVGAVTQALSSTTESDQYLILTPWLSGLTVDEVKAAVVCNGLTGSFRWRLAYRTATTSKESPGAWNPVTDANAPYTSGEVNTGDLPITITDMWVQFAIVYDLSSGGTFGQATLQVLLATRRT